MGWKKLKRNALQLLPLFRALACWGWGLPSWSISSLLILWPVRHPLSRFPARTNTAKKDNFQDYPDALTPSYNTLLCLAYEARCNSCEERFNFFFRLLPGTDWYRPDRMQPVRQWRPRHSGKEAKVNGLPGLDCGLDWESARQTSSKWREKRERARPTELSCKVGSVSRHLA